MRLKQKAAVSPGIFLSSPPGAAALIHGVCGLIAVTDSGHAPVIKNGAIPAKSFGHFGLSLRRRPIVTAGAGFPAGSTGIWPRVAAVFVNAAFRVLSSAGPKLLRTPRMPISLR